MDVKKSLMCLLLFFLVTNCNSNKQKVVPVSQHKIQIKETTDKDSIEFSNTHNQSTKNPGLDLFLNYPLDLNTYKRIKDQANSGSYSHTSHLLKPDYKGFFMRFFIFPGFDDHGPSIIVYRKGQKIGDYYEKNDSLLQIFSDRPDPDLGEADFVNKTHEQILAQFGKANLEEKDFLIYKNETNIVLVLFFGRDSKVKWFKWARLNTKFETFKDLPQALKEEKWR